MDTAAHDTTLATSSGLKQPYHLVDPSPWPIVGAAGGGLLLAGIVLAAHFGNYIMLAAGLALVVLTMVMWWRSVLKESNTPGMHSAVVRLGLRYGMTLFIASEVMFFVGFFWAFFHFALYPDHVLDVANPTWPPPGIHTFDAFRTPLLNTMILLLSGCTVTWAHHALIENDRRNLNLALGITVLLGMSFTCLQAMEYSEAPFHLVGGGIYPGIFFLATGFPRLPCDRRHHLPRRVLVPCEGRRLYPAEAFRLRSRGLVLALRRRGVAVPVCLRLCLGRRPADGGIGHRVDR